MADFLLLFLPFLQKLMRKSLCLILRILPPVAPHLPRRFSFGTSGSLSFVSPFFSLVAIGMPLDSYRWGTFLVVPFNHCQMIQSKERVKGERTSKKTKTFHFLLAPSHHCPKFSALLFALFLT